MSYINILIAQLNIFSLLNRCEFENDVKIQLKSRFLKLNIYYYGNFIYFFLYTDYNNIARLIDDIFNIYA